METIKLGKTTSEEETKQTEQTVSTIAETEAETEKSNTEETSAENSETETTPKIYPEKAMLYEDKSERTENSKFYKLNNGTAKQFITANPMHYFDKNQKRLRTIDNSLEEVDGNLENLYGNYKAVLAKSADSGTLLKYYKDGNGIEWSYVPKSGSVSASQAIVNNTDSLSPGSDIKYENIEPDVDLEYQYIGNNIKENIIVKAKKDEYKYTFNVKTNGLAMRLSEDKTNIELYSTSQGENGENVETKELCIPSPVMYDAEGTQSDEVYYEISQQKNDGEYNFDVIASKDWINAEDRVFPVTIDPQIISYQSDFSIAQVYKKNYNSTTGVITWDSYSSNYIRIYQSGNDAFKTVITIKKSKLNLLSLKITNVNLKMTPYSVSTAGYFNIPEISKNIYAASATAININITDKFKNSTGNFTLSLEPSGTINAYYFESSEIGLTLEIEYLTDENTKPCKKSINLFGRAEGELDLNTGEFITIYNDVPAEDSMLGMGITHIYKKSSEDLHCGNNFRLNLNERLKKNSNSTLDANYIYTDEMGEKHGFKEYFYYLNDSNNRVYIDKSNVVANIDNSLSYNNNFVYKEERSSTGLKAITKLADIKNINAYEQRQNDYKQIEDQVNSYKNALSEIVKMDTTTGEYVGYLNYNQIYEDYSLISYMLITKSEAIQYKSLLNQKNSLQLTSGNEIIPGSSILNSFIATKSSLHEITITLISYIQNCSNASGDQPKINNILHHFNNNETVSQSEYNFLTDDCCVYKEFDTSSSPQLTGAAIKSQIRQRNLLIEQLETERNEYNLQMSLINKQINYILSKKSVNSATAQAYYKEYNDNKLQLNLMPINYLTDGKVIKGFNVNGDLTAVYDNYGNYFAIEFEKITPSSEAMRIKRVYDGKNKEITFEYNSSGQLNYITDTRGRRICYGYNSGDLSEITFVDGKKLTFSYKYENIINIYSYDNINSSISIFADFKYNRARLANFAIETSVEKIDNGLVTWKKKDNGELDNTITSQISLSYSDYQTILTDNDNKKHYYTFNTNGNLNAHYIEENEKVISAEKYSYLNSYCDNIEYAYKDGLGYASLEEYEFVKGDYYYITLNQFNNPSHSETGWVDCGKAKRQTLIDYIYDDNQQLIKQRTTNNTKKLNSDFSYTITPIYTVINYEYNSRGDIVRKESYIEGEELTTGKTIEETVYDDNGNIIKSFTYNRLDTSSKFYIESEVAENGQTITDIDKTGENKTKYEYIAGTSVVKTAIMPNGGKYAYGHDINDTVTAITQSTEDGEENSTQKNYTCGVLTELKSGNNVVDYGYDYKRRIKKIKLNGNEDYLSNVYTDNTTESGITGIVDKVVTTNAKNETFTSITDKNGNLRKVLYGTINQFTWNYNDKSILTSTYDLNGVVNNYTYDSLDRITKISVTNGATPNYITENYVYDDNGAIHKKNIGGIVTQEYIYNYTSDFAKTLNSIGILGSVIELKNDCLNRRSEKVVSYNNAKILGEYYYYSKYGDHATNRISTIRYGNKINSQYVIGDSLKYAYDSMGNIVKVYENGILSVSYAYDKLGRITREDNKDLNKTNLFAYDNNGNILNRSECAYTVKPTEEITGLITYKYTYADNSDRVLSYNGESFVYDAIGNPTTYRGKSATWTKGRQMTAFDGMSFTYNGQGQRLSKTKSGNTVTFNYDAGGNLIKQSSGLEFIYDDSGISGFKYNTTNYFYRKNAQGDITHIISLDGSIVACYNYDAWGNHKVYNPDGTENTSTSFIGYINPIRYRSYYYDIETKLYYLQSRYYDPEVGRFISIDDVSYLDPESINGLNLYAYCNNNPVMNIDPTGTSWKWLTGLSRIVTGICAVVAGVLVIVSGVALLPMLIIAGVTIAAGVLTTVNGVADIQQSITGNNFVRDGIFGGNQTAYNWYAGITEGVALIGSLICGGWLKANQPRIKAYKNIGNSTVANGTYERNIATRPYMDSILTQKQIIKYGKMTKDFIGVYNFTISGSTRIYIQTIQNVAVHSGTWKLTYNIIENVIYHLQLL